MVCRVSATFPRAVAIFCPRKKAQNITEYRDTAPLIPKTIGNRKRDCAWGCARRINTTWKNLHIEKHKSAVQKGVRSAHRADLCFSICRFFQVVFILRAQPHAKSLFLISSMGSTIAPLESRNQESEIFWQRQVRTHCEFQRHNGDHLRRKRWEVWREKRKVRIYSSPSANFW